MCPDHVSQIRVSCLVLQPVHGLFDWLKYRRAVISGIPVYRILRCILVRQFYSLNIDRLCPDNVHNLFHMRCRRLCRYVPGRYNRL